MGEKPIQSFGGKFELCFFIKAAHEVQSSTLELINGLVSLVQNPSIPDVSHEAMEALLVLHQPEKIEMWNPEAPINTFWDLSSQVLFSMSQKLIQHLIVNYTDVLKWLRKILECRNQFLKKHRDYANVGSQIAICRQAHIKLEVVLFMYLWSIDSEAVLVSMSCFSLLCEEADIRCGTDEMSASILLPNYGVYEELAQLSSTLNTVNFFKPPRFHEFLGQLFVFYERAMHNGRNDFYKRQFLALGARSQSWKLDNLLN